MKTLEHIEKKTSSSACAYRTSCDCGCDNQITLEVEDDLINQGTLSLNFTAHRCSWWVQGFWKRLYSRVSVAWQYLTTGEMELEESLIFNSSEHVRDLSALLANMADDMEVPSEAKRIALLAEVGILLEALNASVLWELPRSVIGQMEEILPKLRRDLKGPSAGKDTKLWDLLYDLMRSIKINKFVVPEIRNKAGELLPSVRKLSNKKPLHD